MSKVTMIGCDVHDASLVLKFVVGQEAAVKGENERERTNGTRSNDRFSFLPEARLSAGRRPAPNKPWKCVLLYSPSRKSNRIETTSRS